MSRMSRVSVRSEPPIEDDDERRRFDRVELTVRIDYATVDELFSEFTRDVNEGGLLVESDEPRDPGTKVSMQFHLPGSDEVLCTTGTVVWSQPPTDTEPGTMGVEFGELDADARNHIDALVRTLRSSR